MANTSAPADYNALLDRQNSQEQGLFNQYQSAVSAQPKMTDIFGGLQDKYGIPQAQQQINGYKDQITRVQGLLNNLVPDVAQRTQGTLTTQAMRDRMVSAEGAPMTRELNGLGVAMQPLSDIVTSGNQMIDRMLPLYSQEEQMALDPLKTRLGMMGSDFSRQLQALQAEDNARLSAQQSSSLASYLAPYLNPNAPPQQLPSIPRLPALPAPLSLSVAQPQSINLLQAATPSRQLQGGPVLLQGTSPYLQGSGFRLQ